MRTNKFKNIIVIITAIIIVAVLGSVFVNLGMDFFDTLKKPTQWIPNFVIPIVWTIIYLLFALLLSLWEKQNDIPKRTYILLIINGILNILWCLLFFTLEQLFLGNILIIINLIFGFILIFDIKKYKQLYFYILSIYPIWLSIATTLNLATWILN